MKLLLLLALLGASACNVSKETKSSSEKYTVNLTENNCHREGTFTSKGALCEFLKNEIKGYCVPSLAKAQYEGDCGPVNSLYQEFYTDEE